MTMRTGPSDMNGVKRIWADQRVQLALVWSVLLFLPLKRLAELPMLALLIAGIVLMIRQGRALWADPAVRLFVFVFACYWVPIALAAIDAVNLERSGLVALAGLRFLFAGISMVWVLRSPQAETLWKWCAWLLVFWLVDALVQYFFGFDLLGQTLHPERLNGVFGDEGSLKLGPVLATLSPLLLEHARRHWGASGFAAAYLVTLVVVLLTGSRAGWIIYGLVTMAFFWTTVRHYPGFRRSLALIGVGVIVVTVALYALSPRFHDKLDTSLLVFKGDIESLDRAIAFRLPIWRTAGRMYVDNPINGVGARGFRYAYGDYAGLDDHWVNEPGGFGGAFHAHHILLDVGTETGTVGIIGLLLAVWLLMRRWRHLAPSERQAAFPVALGLAVALFPLNTHYSIYAATWSITLWWLIAVFCGVSRPGNDR